MERPVERQVAIVTGGVAELVAFLALSEPCFVTGQAITVDGFQWNM